MVDAIFCCNYWDVFPILIGRINKQFVLRVQQQRVIIPEFNKINMIKDYCMLSIIILLPCLC